MTYKIDEPLLEKLWNDGLLDREIGEKIGCSTRIVANYRRDHQMPTNAGITNWDNGGAKPHSKRSYSKLEGVV